tara:strand:+ start:1030 stop:1221 length:192 start_codon:yes stop_codon:yes gene_type:complete
VLTYPEIRGVLAQMEEEFKEQAKHPQQEAFAQKAVFVLAMVDKKLGEKIQEKSNKGKNQKFFF